MDRLDRHSITPYVMPGAQPWCKWHQMGGQDTSHKNLIPYPVYGIVCGWDAKNPEGRTQTSADAH